MVVAWAGDSAGQSLALPAAADSPPLSVAAELAVVAAESAAESEPPIVLDEQSAKASLQWLVQQALARMPRTFDGDKDWGQTKRVWAGVKVRFDGGKLKTHRRHRQLKHGRWIQYQVDLPAATAARTLDVRVDAVAPLVDPATGDQRWQIHSVLVAPMEFTARIQRWNLGVRFFSLTIRGRIKIRVRSTTSLGVYPDYAKVVPDLVIDPRVEQATLHLESFEVDRLSHIGGDVAEVWGEVVQEVLLERFIRRQQDGLVEKLNRSIDKERSELRISWTDWLEH